LEEQIGVVQDAADKASRKRSARALARTQRQLLQIGIDSRIVVNDIIRYAKEDRGWGDGVLDFTEVAGWDPWEPKDTEVPTKVLPGLEGLEGEAPSGSLAEFLRQGQINDGPRVSQLETDLREILGTSAELASASENLRLQRMVVWLTVIAAIATIVAAWAAVIALR
jgi:hypothetical protein